MASDRCTAAVRVRIRGHITRSIVVVGRTKRALGRMLRAAPMLTMMLIGGLGPCAKLKGGANSEPSSAPSMSSATIAAQGASAQAAASASAAAAAAAAASASAAAANAAAVERANKLLTDIKWLVAHNTTMNPAKGGEGDASTKCDEVDAWSAKLSATSNPELKKILDEAAGICAFDVPLVIASESLDHLQTPSSQASKLLMCSVANKETDRARAIRPRDPKIRRLDARRITACGR